MASSSNDVTINQDTLQRELQDLRALKEKVIDERKQHDGELKGLNMQVQRKVPIWVILNFMLEFSRGWSKRACRFHQMKYIPNFLRKLLILKLSIC